VFSSLGTQLFESSNTSNKAGKELQASEPMAANDLTSPILGCATEHAKETAECG